MGRDEHRKVLEKEAEEEHLRYSTIERIADSAPSSQVVRVSGDGTYVLRKFEHMVGKDNTLYIGYNIIKVDSKKDEKANP